MKLKNSLFIIFIIVTSYQLNAMESETATTSEEEITVVWPIFEKEIELDFQIYQLLSEATKNNPQVYLPEIMPIIVTNLCDITEHYGKYGSCLEHPEYFIKFIQGCLKKSMSIDRIVSILKMRLRYGDTSLSKLQDNYGSTVFHFIDIIHEDYHLQSAQIICLIAGDQAWDLLKKGDNNGYTIFHSSYLSIESIKNLLGFAPNNQELWNLICMKTQFVNETVFYRLLHLPDMEVNVIKKLLASAPSPKDAWVLINAQNYYESNMLLRSKTPNDEVREILESYRPTNL